MDPSCMHVMEEKLFQDSTEEDLQFVKVSRVQFLLSSARQNAVAIVDKSLDQETPMPRVFTWEPCPLKQENLKAIDLPC